MFSYTYNVTSTQRPGSTITLRARAFITVKHGKSPTKSIRTKLRWVVRWRPGGPVRSKDRPVPSQRRVTRRFGVAILTRAATLGGASSLSAVTVTVPGMSRSTSVIRP